jgi:riboflavin kinase / FMN adenylyltransferase
MKREFGLDNIRSDSRSVVTVGTYDGVHLGHQAILAYLRERAEYHHGSSVIVTFDPHPREVVHGETVPLLTTIEERAELLEQYGIGRFVCITFTPEFASLSGEAFVENVLVRSVGLKEIVIGYDHAFGRGRQGDRTLLEHLGEKHGFTVDVIPAQVVEEHIVSSTQIRQALEAGDVARAETMLGRPYTLRGTVVHGDKRGRTIGFPTANIDHIHPRKVRPGRGVYAVEVLLDGRWLAGMLNIGQRPTFEGDGTRIEVHILDFEGDIYGRPIEIAFREKLREEQRFDSVDHLRSQLSRDRERCTAVLATLNSARREPKG